MTDHSVEPTGPPPGRDERGAGGVGDLDPDSLDMAQLDAELEADDPRLRGSLRALLEPPSDFEGRVADTVTRQLQGRSAAGVALDLLGLGVRTLATILTEPGPPADRNGDAGPAGPARDDPATSGPSSEGRAAK